MPPREPSTDAPELVPANGDDEGNIGGVDCDADVKIKL